jgi:hypothetical protein
MSTGEEVLDGGMELEELTTPFTHTTLRRIHLPNVLPTMTQRYAHLARNFSRAKWHASPSRRAHRRSQAS